MKLSDEIRAMTGVPVTVADAVAALEAENARLREALEPLATQFLWPDDLGFEMAEDIKLDPDYDEDTNNMTSEEVFILRGDVRRARAALKQEDA